MVLEQNGEKALERAEHRAVQHDWGALRAVFIDVVGTEALWHVEVNLQGSALPVATDRIPEDELELRPVEGALPLVHAVVDAGGVGSGRQGRFCPVPDGIVAHPLWRPIRELDRHLLEAEVPVDVENQLGDGHRFGSDLVLGDKYMTVVLGESTYTHEPVQRA